MNHPSVVVGHGDHSSVRVAGRDDETGEKGEEDDQARGKENDETTHLTHHPLTGGGQPRGQIGAPFALGGAVSELIVGRDKNP